MAMFESSKILPIVLPDLTPVADETMDYFQKQGYEVASEPTITGGWAISITKGNLFKTVVGLKTALKISIEPSPMVTTVKADVGLFGTQAIPLAIGYLVFWPVLISQMWGMVRQAKLDDEAIGFVEASMKAHAPHAEGQTAVTGEQTAYCPACGAQIPQGAKFCPGCGAKRA